MWQLTLVLNNGAQVLSSLTTVFQFLHTRPGWGTICDVAGPPNTTGHRPLHFLRYLDCDLYPCRLLAAVVSPYCVTGHYSAIAWPHWQTSQATLDDRRLTANCCSQTNTPCKPPATDVCAAGHRMFFFQVATGCLNRPIKSCPPPVLYADQIL